jgi:hypothetical protein
MTTARQVKKLLQVLVARHPDTALIANRLVLKPVRHVLRSIHLERSGEARSFYPTWSIMHLCQPLRRFPETWTKRIPHSGHYTWAWDDPLMPADFSAVIEEETLPFLREIDRLDDFVAATGPDRFLLNSLDAFPLRKVVVDVARGDLDAARSICATLLTGRTMWSAPDLREVFSMIVDALCPLLAADDRVGLARQLREWEAYTARNLKIESIWEPTPFPLELQSR